MLFHCLSEHHFNDPPAESTAVLGGWRVRSLCFADKVCSPSHKQFVTQFNCGAETFLFMSRPTATILCTQDTYGLFILLDYISVEASVYLCLLNEWILCIVKT